MREAVSFFADAKRGALKWDGVSFAFGFLTTASPNLLRAPLGAGL